MIGDEVIAIIARALALMCMRAALDAAAKAMVEGDLVEMIRLYKELRNVK